jgi:predicted glycosyltransferase
MLHPDDVTPAAMRDALRRLLELPPPDEPVDAYEGADTAAALLADLGRRMRVVPMPLHAAHGRRAGSRHRPGGNSP